MTHRGFSSSTKNLKYFAVLLLGLQCIVNAQPADSALGAGLSWSARFPSIDLFNLPAFGRSLFGATERPLIKARAKLEVNTIDPNIIEDSFLKTPELVKKYGYPAERHHVETEDGYILELHRIARPGGVPVMLTHGLLDSSATWVIMGPNKGLAYHLFDRGYDVWMTNVRGNTYSRNHTKYRTSHAKYWDFSFHEMGVYDLPASIDYVLNVTQYKQLHYIGHSQGTMIYWVMCSERPEYSDKVLLMQALAPVSFVKHCRSPVVDFLAFFQDPLAMLLKLIGAHEFLPSNEFVTMFNQIICDDTTITTEICSNVMFLVAGFDKAQLNETMIPVVLGHAPAGASTKQMQHFGQLKRSGKFRQYDYGWIRNHWRYNSITPPDYKLQNVRTKVALHYSANDWLATTQDVNLLAQNLPNVVGKFKVNYEWFNHLDFVWSIDAYELLYKKVFDLMAQAESGMKNKMNNKTAPKEEEEVE